MDELISIIVPVYNCIDKNLDKCLESLVNQSYQNIEVLLIDDGSSDASGVLCDKYAEKDSRIKVFHLKNGGVSRARNFGLDIFKGNYCSFVDGDDVVAKDYIKILYKAIKKYETRMAICKAYEAGLEPNFNWKYEIKETQLLTVDDTYRFCSSEYKHFSVWGGLYRRDVLKDIRFSEKFTNGEDTLFFVQILNNELNISYVPIELYCYIEYKKSAVNRPYLRQRYTEILAWEEIISITKYRSKLWKKEAELGYLSACCRGLRSIIWLNDKKNEYYKILRKKMVQGIPCYLVSTLDLREKVVFITVCLFPGLYAKIHQFIAKREKWEYL